MISNGAAITAGHQFTLAVTGNGQVYAWGDNEAGQLGTNVNDVVNSVTPLLVAGISNVVLLSTHPDGVHSLAITVNNGTNQYYAWGDNSAGQIGDGVADETPVGAGDEEDNRFPPALLKFDDVCTTCVPLGTGGVFTAQYTGTLRLYFNDVLGGAFQNNSGAYTAKVFAVGVTNATNVVVQAKNGLGTVVGIVIKGSNYTYSASGVCVWGTPSSADPNGNDPVLQLPVDCSGTAGVLPCPNAHCFSLFGRIQ